MNKSRFPDRTITIYLQIAETAILCQDPSLSQSMLLAAYEQANDFSQPVDLKTLTRLAEFLVMAKLTKQAEEIFNVVLKKIEKNCDDNWLKARIYDGLAEVHFVNCHFDKARKKFAQVLKILTTLPHVDPLMVVARQRKLQLLNLRQENIEKKTRLANSSR